MLEKVSIAFQLILQVLFWAVIGAMIDKVQALDTWVSDADATVQDYS